MYPLTKLGVIEKSCAPKEKINILEDKITVIVKQIKAEQRALFCGLKNSLTNKAKHATRVCRYCSEQGGALWLNLADTKKKCPGKHIA